MGKAWEDYEKLQENNGKTTGQLWKTIGKRWDNHGTYPLLMTDTALEMAHRNSSFTYDKW